MIESFGPWATAIDTGANPQLSTFWKRRMTMLPFLAHVMPRPSRRTLLLLGTLAAVLGAWPTIRWVTLSGNAVGSDDGLALAQAPGKAPEGSKGEKAPIPDEYLPRPSQAEEKILAALGKPTTVDFIDLPLEDAISFLKDYHNLNVWLDKGTLTDEGFKLDQ